MPKKQLTPEEKLALQKVKQEVLISDTTSKIQAFESRPVLNKKARPDKISPALREELRTHVLLGAPPDRALLAIGVPSDVWEYWKAKAKRDEAEHKRSIIRAFVEEIYILEAMAEMELLKQVRIRPAGEWQAPMTILERRRPRVWGQRQVLPKEEQAVTFKYELSINDKKRIENVVNRNTNEALKGYPAFNYRKVDKGKKLGDTDMKDAELKEITITKKRTIEMDEEEE